MKEYVPNRRIVNRAVELWVNMLRNPDYDNGDSSTVGFMSQVLVHQLPKNNDEETLSKFGIELRKILLAPFERESIYNSRKEKYTVMVRDLNVDYGPCEYLRIAADVSGLKMEFPWKTRMWLSEDYLSISCGYGAESEYHYPLNDGSWLVASLYGSDIKKVIALIEDGYIGSDLTTIP